MRGDNRRWLHRGIKALLVGCLAASLLLNVFPAGAGRDGGRWQFFGQANQRAYASESDEFKNQIARLSDVLSLLEARYYKADKGRDLRGLIDAAIFGMVSSLGDPYTSYMLPEEYEKVTRSMEGTFGGIGVTIERVGQYITIISVMDGLPAQAGGLKAKDRIVRVGDENILGASLDRASSLIRGPVDSEVKLRIEREGTGQFDVTLKRQVVTVHVVESRMLESGIGYINIKTFNNDNVSQEVKEAYEALKAQGLDGLVLDLRNNGGGLLNEAVCVAGMFVPPGTIVTVKERGRPTRRIKHDGLPDPIALAVLTNEGTASGSEIVAAAIQDRGTGVVVGTHTFGKGLIQTIYRLDGDYALKITTGEYLTPAGRSIHGIGVIPDVIVEDTRPSFVTVETGAPGEKGSGDPKDVPGQPDSQRNGVQEEDAQEEDVQLEAALRVIRERIRSSVKFSDGGTAVFDLGFGRGAIGRVAA